MRRTTGIPCVIVLALAAGVVAQDEKKPKDQPRVVKDRIKGSINHGRGQDEWGRIAGKGKILDGNTLEYQEGTRIKLGMVAPEPGQQGMIDGKLYPCGKDAAEFLRKMIGNQAVVCLLQDDNSVLSAYVGD